MRTGRVVGVITEVVMDSEEETVNLPGGKIQKHSVEGESVGVAIPATYVSILLQSYGIQK